jgi:uncharacterized protein (TIGR03437 family)
VATPIDLGEASEKTYLMLFGTGIRGSSLAYVNADIGGVKVPVLGVAAQGQYQGLDQVNVELPRQLIGKGEVDVNINACSSRANPVRIHVR